jgi:peroxiredoxin
MNIKRLFQYILTTLVLTVTITASSHGMQTNHDGYIIVTGQLTGKDSLVNQNPMLSIYTGSDINNMNEAPNSGKVHAIHWEDNRFYIKVPVKTRFNYLKLKLIRSVNFLSSGLPVVEAGDSVHVDIRGQIIHISGSNAPSMNYQRKAYESLVNFNRISSVKSNVSNLFNACDSSISQLTTLKELFGLSTDLKKLLRTNTASMLRMALLQMLNPLRFGNDPILKTSLKHHMDSYFNKWAVQSDPLLLNNCPGYLDCVLYYYQLRTMFSTDHRDKKFNELYEEINSKTSGLLRDKLISYLFCKKSGLSGDALALLPLALEKMQDSASKSLLQNFMNVKGKGVKAYDFNLSDVNGNRVSLTQFRGKTVICHFWFTGCWACIRLTQNLEPMIERFRGDSSVVFININADNKREQWLKSVEGGNYTSKDEISLFTDGFGKNHPLMRHYNYTSFPKLMLIDKEGNLISSEVLEPTDTETQLGFENLVKYSK